MNMRTEDALTRDEQAAEWCMRLAEEKLAPQDQRQFDAWIASPGNREAFELALSVWRSVDAAAEQPEFIRLRTDALENFRDANRLRWARRPTVWRWASLAAGVAVLAVAAAFFALRSDAQIIQTAIGERRVVTLPEGSQVSLDAATRVKVRLTDNRRELELLAGRARFNVVKDPLRPFSVAVGQKVIVATGTSFSVERLQKQLRVVLYEGRVEVLQPTPVILTAGRELLASIDEPAAPTIAATDTSRSLSWETGQLVFVDEPLGSAVEHVNRYSQRKLVIEDPQTGELRLNGVFNAGDNAAFIEAVRTLLPVDVLESKERITIKQRNSN